MSAYLISEWPSVTDRRELPEASGVYAILTFDGEPVYIGESGDIRRRFEIGHRPRLRALGKYRIAYYLAVEPERNEIECHLINELQPKFNIKRKNRPESEIADARERALYRVIDLLTANAARLTVTQINAIAREVKKALPREIWDGRNIRWKTVA
jgi:hypothetical protein